MLARGKRIYFGTGQGSSTGGVLTGTDPSKMTKVPGNIVLDPTMKGDAVRIVQALSHEFGHFTYRGSYDIRSASAYNMSELRDEAAAVMSNIKIDREILAASNGSLAIGTPSSLSNQLIYDSAYNTYLVDKNLSKALNQIAVQFGPNEYPSTNPLNSPGKLVVTYTQSNIANWNSQLKPLLSKFAKKAH
jgi:hypothetical protein